MDHAFSLCVLFLVKSADGTVLDADAHVALTSHAPESLNALAWITEGSADDERDAFATSVVHTAPAELLVCDVD